MANIGELTVGLRFVPDDASMQQAVRQSQQSLSKGLIAKLTLDDTEFQQTAQKSIAQNRQLERQANEERRAERQRYMNFWKQSLSEQDAAEKRQAQANREAAAEKKRAANDYATFWKQALREQEQAEKAAARAAIQAAREKEAEEKRAYQEGMQRLRNANQTAILNGRLASEARRAEQRAVDDVVRALANQQAAQRNLWQAGKLLTVDLIEGQRALQKEALDTAKTFGTQTNEYRKLTQVAAAAQRTMDQATGKITPGGFGHNVVLGLQNSGLFNQIAALGGPAGQTLGIVASGFSTARKTALEFSGATNTAATAAGFLTGGLTALGVAAVGVAGGLTHLASTGMQELKTLQGGLNVLTASGVENLTGFRQNLNQMKEDLGKVGQGLSTADLTASAGELVKANLSVTDSLKVLAPAAKLAAAENTNLNDTSAQLLMNTRQYGLGVEMVGNVADMLAKAGNLAAGTANDLSLGLGKVGGTGMQAGIQLNDLLGMLVELDLKGMSAADTGADALRTALSSLADPSEKAKGILAELNIELEDSEGKARPAGAIMAELGEKMRGMGIKVNASTGELTGNGEALRTVAGLMDTRAAAAVINLTGEWRTHGQAIKDSQGYLTEYANTMTTGVEPAQRRLQTAWKDAGLAFVEGFANPIADFLDHRATPFIESLGQIFTKLGQIKDFGQLQVELKIKDTDGGLTILGKLLGGGLAAVGQSAKGWMDFGSDVDLRRRLVNAGVMTMARTPGEDWNQLQQIRSDPAGWAKRLEDALAANTKAAEKNGDALLNTVNALPSQLMPAPNTVNLGTGLPRGDTLSKMNPEFQRLMAQLMVEYITSNPQGLAPYIHEGFRTVERQNALYAQGRTKPGQIVTNAKGGQSIHNYGVAADIYWRDPKTGKVVSFNDPRAIEAAKALGQLATAKGLLWGGTPGWGGPVDMPHIQENISWQDAQKKYGPPGTVNTSVSPKVNPPTPTDPNAKLKKALEEGQHLINQYRLAVASGNDVWKAKVNEAIDAFKKKNKAAWKEYADDYAAISKKGQSSPTKPQKPEETDLQREQRLRREQVALQKLQADIRNADADRLKKIIGTGVTANNSLQKINLAEDELKRRGELEEKQRQQAKAAREKAAKEDAVDRERLLAQRKADGERDIKATIELAQRQGETEKSILLKYANERRQLLSKAQAGTLTAEDVDTYKAHLAALVKEAGKAGVASSEALKGAHVSALKFIDTALDSNALAIEHTASQYDELTDAVSRATARSNTHRATLEDVLELLPGNADEWDDFVKIMEQLDGKGNLAAGVMDTLRQKIKDLKAEIAGEQQNYAETLQFNLDTLSNRTWEGLLKLYDQATATRDKTLLNAVMDEMEKRGLEVQKTAQDAWEAFYNPSGKTDYTLPSLIPKQPMSTAEGATTDFSWTAGWMADQSRQKALDDYVLLLDDMSEAELKAAQDAALLAGDREKLDMVTERLIARQKAWVAALKSGTLQTDLPNAGEITLGGFTPGPMNVKPTDGRPDLTPTMKLRAESFLLAAKSADSFTKSLENLTLAELEAKLATASTDEQFDEIAQKWREVAAALRMPAEEGNSGPLSMEEWRQSVQTLTDQFDAGEISALDYSEGIKGINADLLGLANAADKAGNPRLAQAYRDMAQQFRELTPEIAAALKQFNKLQQYGEWANQVLGALGKLAQAMSQTEQQYDATGKALNTPWSDLAANIEGAQKAIALAVDMSKDVAKLVASGGADIGAWISLATKVVSAIADALSGFKKAYADAQRMRDDFASSNPLLKADDYQKVSVQSRGWLADIFVGPKVVNEIDKVGVQFANSFAQHVADGFTAGLKKAVMEGDTSQIGKNLRMNTFEGIVDGMIDSFKTEIIKEIMAPFLKEWSAAMKTPDTADDLAALNTLDTLMPRLDQAGEAWANNVVPRLQSIQQKWGLTPDATGGNTGNLFGNAPGVQLGIPQITVSLPETALKPIADLSSTVARLESLLDKGLTLNATNIQISLPDSFLQANALFNSSVSIFAGAVPAFAAGSADLKMVPTEFRTVFAEILTYMRTNSPSGKLPPLSGNGGLA